MKYAVTESPDARVSLPKEMLEALGHPEEIELEPVPRGFLLRGSHLPPHAMTREERLAAIDEYCRSGGPDCGFTPEEWAELKAEQQPAEQRSEERILREIAGWTDDDFHS